MPIKYIKVGKKMNLILKSQNGTHSANAELKNGKIVVMKGSKINLKDSFEKMSRNAFYYRHNEEYVNEEGYLLENIVFDSVTTAAQFVTGRSVNGNIAWRVEDKMSLKEYLNKHEFEIKINKIDSYCVFLQFSSRQRLKLTVKDIKYFYDGKKVVKPDVHIPFVIFNETIIRLNNNFDKSKVRTITFIVDDKTNEKKWAISIPLDSKEIKYKLILNW